MQKVHLVHDCKTRKLKNNAFFKNRFWKNILAFYFLERTSTVRVHVEEGDLFNSL